MSPVWPVMSSKPLTITSSTSSKTSATTTTAKTSSKTSVAKTSSRASSSASAASSSTPSAVGTKYLIVFGDSYSSTGFYIQGGYPSSSDPIGQPALPGTTTTGGLNWVGMVTSEFNSSLTLTYDWAYYGADTDASIVYSYATYCFDGQVGEFEDAMVPAPTEAPWTADNSLAVVWIGINDVGEAFWEDIELPLDAIMTRYWGLVQDLYDDGLRDFVIMTVPPFDQAPVFAEQTASALAGLQGNISAYNEALESNLATFKSNNTNVKAQLFNTSSYFWTALDNPTAYGATDATCMNSDGTTCLWYDDYHPGQAIHKLVAEGLVSAVEFF
ncbi:hypothetical protein VP1G_03199 [Cytospora mali]|uniref:Thermolabile hemolysin n=1 Tax=Cytospora mali TaxID=578113 RepID=A0A194UVV1_CYTMA|nr:hypothetical protein VP1G_03199 [Valsa mali var. pyri (nom. inval.)]